MKNTRDPEGNEAKNLLLASPMAGKIVLEIGCGNGWLTWQLAPSTGRIVGIDPGIDDLRLARTSQPPLTANVLLTASMGEALPFSTGSFDIAFFSNSL